MSGNISFDNENYDRQLPVLSDIAFRSPSFSQCYTYKIVHPIIDRKEGYKGISTKRSTAVNKHSVLVNYKTSCLV